MAMLGRITDGLGVGLVSTGPCHCPELGHVFWCSEKNEFYTHFCSLGLSVVDWGNEVVKTALSSIAATTDSASVHSLRACRLYS